MASTTSDWNPRLKTIFSVGIWLLFWHFAAVAIGHRFILATPLQVVQALIRLAPTALFWQSLISTAIRIIAGFLLGMILGSLLAYAASLSTWAAALIGPPMRVITSVPVVSFVILVLLLAGASGLTVTIAALIVAPIAFNNVGVGLSRIDPDLDDVAQVFAASRWQRFGAVTWPAVAPYLAAACQTGFGLAWKAGISAEVIGIPRGSIGARLYAARLTLATADVLAWTVVIVAVSWLGERFLSRLLAHWIDW